MQSEPAFGDDRRALLSAWILVVGLVASCTGEVAESSGDEDLPYDSAGCNSGVCKDGTCVLVESMDGCYHEGTKCDGRNDTEASRNACAACCKGQCPPGSRCEIHLYYDLCMTDTRVACGPPPPPACESGQYGVNAECPPPPCEPQCYPPFCGQGDGCGGVCPDTDALCTGPFCGQVNACGVRCPDYDRACPYGCGYNACGDFCGDCGTCAMRGQRCGYDIGCCDGLFCDFSTQSCDLH